MTQLFINDIEIALGDNFSFKQIDENPVITSVGEFTLDIVISLQIGQNARAFGLINRRNKRDIPKEWKASMIVNNKVSHGKAIFISNTDTTVTVQYVSGNSELLYFANQDTKIWEMDWGTESAIDYARARQSIYQVGYVTNGYHFVCTPVKLKDTIVNKYTLANEPGSNIPATAFPINGISENIIMMPYLLHYVEKMADLFGFTIKSNVLLSNYKAKCTYLLNNYSSLKYADALPDITLSEFIEIIEDEFNVIFIVDKTSQSLEITYRYQNISSRSVIPLPNVIDTYTRNVNEDSDDKLNRFMVNKFTYNLPNDIYYKYHRLDSYWVPRSTIIYKNAFDDIVSDLSGPYAMFYNTNFGFWDASMDDYYFFADKPTQELFSRKITSERSVFLFNKFRDEGFGVMDIELILQMIPPVMEKDFLVVISNPGVPEAKQFNIDYQLPVSQSELSNPEHFVVMPFVQMIEGGAPNNSRSSVLETCLYMGVIKAFVTSTNASITFSTYYPYSCNDVYPDFGILPSSADVARFEFWASHDFKNSVPERGYRLRNISTSYSKNKYFDTSKEYVMEMEDSPLLSTSFLFEIGNAIYIPIRFERTISSKSEMVTGYFYKML